MTNIDTIRELLAEALEMVGIAPVSEDDDILLGDWRERTKATLSTIDPDAIRREYYRMGVEASLAEWKSLHITIGRDEMIDNVREVLLGTEPAREGSK